jgi:hypothetical protein
MVTDTAKGFWVDTSAIALATNAKGKKESWIQAMPMGTWEHPFWGEIKFDESKLTSFVKNFDNRVTSMDLDIDFEHKLYSGEAAGWVTAVEFRPNEGLYYLVEWTPTGVEAIENKRFRYFSPEYYDKWKHPQTNAEFSDVLMGGGLTNRPFLKGIAPVNLSEVFATQSGVQMSGTNPGAPGSQPTPPAPTPPTPPAPPPPPAELTAEGLGKLLSENPDIINNLPQVKALSDKVTALETENKTLAAASHGASVELTLEKFTKGQRVLSAAAIDKAREVLLTAPKELGDKITELLETLVTGDGAVVQMGEQGGGQPSSRNTDAIKKYTDAVKEIQEKRKLSYRDAAIVLSQEDKQLHNDYMEATLASRSS